MEENYEIEEFLNSVDLDTLRRLHRKFNRQLATMSVSKMLSEQQGKKFNYKRFEWTVLYRKFK